MSLLEWLYNNEALIGWLVAISVISIVVTIIVVPIILMRLPRDYFLYPERHRVPWRERNRFLRIPFLLMKNLLGSVLLLGGILMLALPGQGLLTIFIGLILMEFPGKFRVECWLINRPLVLQAVNWIRTKAGRAPLLTHIED